MRVQADGDYIQCIEDLFDVGVKKKHKFNDYDVKVYENIRSMVNDIKKQDREHGLSRMVAGYAWKWQTGKGLADHDIKIDGLKMKWNSVTKDWVNSPNAINEIGCIHTVQGYDLNYVGVIVGSEISFNPIERKIVIDKEKYFDKNGKVMPFLAGFQSAGFAIAFICHHFYKKHKAVLENIKFHKIWN